MSGKGIPERGRRVVGHLRRKRADIDSSTMVRTCLVILLSVLWLALIAAGLSKDYDATNTLDSYWASLSAQQQDQTCMSYSSYPDFTKNTLVGMLHNSVTARDADNFLWRSCG